MESLKGTIERIVYHNEENHFTVARLKLPGETAPRFRGPTPLTTVVGTMPGVKVGETVVLEGEWAVHAQHGREFRVTMCRPQPPTTIEGIRRYLGSGLIKGIGPKTARSIVEHFGEATLDIIEEQPARLQEVAGISALRVGMISKAWSEQREIKSLMLFLQSHDISTSLAARIYKHYGADALDKVCRNPYQLERDIAGVGFHKADAVAQKLGISAESLVRRVAGLRFLLAQAADDGHVYLPCGELLQRGAELLECSEDDLQPALGELVRHHAQPEQVQAFQEDDRVYLAPFFRSERGVARLLTRLRTTPSSLLFAGPRPLPSATPTPPFLRNPPQGGQGGGLRGDRGSCLDWDAALIDPTGGPRLVLAESQRAAVGEALTHKVSILTGGPGTGKTTTLRALIRILEYYGVTYCLTAPTGRAAKRMSEATGRPARTLHRLLEFSPGRNEFAYNEENPLAFSFIIADEASMLDILLTYNLLKAVPPTAHVLLVGDVDQLPSVGPGNVLRDLIAAGTIPTVRLHMLFRQAQHSQIIVAAHEINAGRVPVPLSPSPSLRLPPPHPSFATPTPPFPSGNPPPGARVGDSAGPGVIPAAAGLEEVNDFFVIREEDPERVLTLLKTVVAERIPRRFGLDPLNAVQVISPMHRGALGVGILNEQLQALLNPSRGTFSELEVSGRLFRVGDRVMQVRNNYDKNVFNGDMGRIAAIDRENQIVRVDYPAEGVIASAQTGTIPGVMREPQGPPYTARRRGAPSPRPVRMSSLGPLVEIDYDFAELEELTLAYAISAHKAQGSEFPAVVMPLTMAHYTMLQRNLLYTTITRARQLCVVIGSPRALQRAVENNTVASRYSALAGRLRLPLATPSLSGGRQS